MLVSETYLNQYKIVIDEFYGGIFTEPEIMSDHTIQELLMKCYKGMS